MTEKLQNFTLFLPYGRGYPPVTGYPRGLFGVQIVGVGGAHPHGVQKSLWEPVGMGLVHRTQLRALFQKIAKSKFYQKIRRKLRAQLCIQGVPLGVLYPDRLHGHARTTLSW